MKTKVILILITALATCKAQDLRFMNTNQSLVNVNPSFAGSNGFVRNQFSYRNQWPSLSGNFVSLSNTFDMYLKPIKGGIAVTGEREWFGGYQTNSGLGLAYAQHFEFSDGKNKLIPSLQLFYRQVTIDVNQIHFSDSMFITGPFPVDGKQNLSTGDLNAGLMYSHNDKLFIGVSAFHVTQPNFGVFGEDQLGIKYGLYASYNLSLGEHSVLQFLYNGQSQDNYRISQVGANFIYKHLVTGAGYTSDDEVYLNGGYRANWCIISLGYDVSVSRLSGNTAGSWELHASYNLRNKENRKVLTSFEKL